MKLSTGVDSTLGSYLSLCRQVFGARSHATQWIESKIASTPNGEAEPVLADESQMVNLLQQLAAKDVKDEPNGR